MDGWMDVWMGVYILGSKEFVAPFVTHWVPLLPHEEMARILKSILYCEIYIHIYICILRYAFGILVPLLPHEEMKQILKSMIYREFCIANS
jgi:hypothetical protein